MPRQGRLDAPGVLHHVMIRGIERRSIFKDDQDREDFLARLARLLPETQTACYAWALMPNHVHLLLRPGAAPLATLMRRLLTGYAVRFNHRHKRQGLLFQNRYKSVVCQEDRYFTELVRYIHLNPLRARRVADVAGLHRYPYSGHSALLGKTNRPWQATDPVLTGFATTARRARRAYAAYVEAGIAQGRRPDLTGGGLIRSLGGWAEVERRRDQGRALMKSDERILGESDFVEAILAQAQERYSRQTAWKRRGMTFERLVGQVAEVCQVDPQDVVAQGRPRWKVRARNLLCFWAVRELGFSLTEMARRLGMSPPGMGYAVQRGEAMTHAGHYALQP